MNKNIHLQLHELFLHRQYEKQFTNLFLSYWRYFLLLIYYLNIFFCSSFRCILTYRWCTRWEGLSEGHWNFFFQSCQSTKWCHSRSQWLTEREGWLGWCFAEEGYPPGETEVREQRSNWNGYWSAFTLSHTSTHWWQNNQSGPVNNGSFAHWSRELVDASACSVQDGTSQSELAPPLRTEINLSNKRKCLFSHTTTK